MEARQQRIADLARTVLPVLEAQEQRGKVRKIAQQFLLLVLTAITAYSAAQYFRPITYSEEKTLKILLQYSAQKKPSSPTEATQQFLADLHLKHLADLRAHQWNDAINRLTADAE